MIDIKCTVCNYTRKDMGVLAADVYATKHSLKRYHPVMIMTDGVLTHWVGENRTEPLFNDDPPF